MKTTTDSNTPPSAGEPVQGKVDEVGRVVSEMWDEIRHTGIATSDQLQAWARSLSESPSVADAIPANVREAVEYVEQMHKLTGDALGKVVAALRADTAGGK